MIVVFPILSLYDLFCLNVLSNIYKFECSFTSVNVAAKAFVQSWKLLDGCHTSDHTLIEVVLVNRGVNMSVDSPLTSILGIATDGQYYSDGEVGFLFSEFVLWISSMSVMRKLGC